MTKYANARSQNNLAAQNDAQSGVKACWYVYCRFLCLVSAIQYVYFITYYWHMHITLSYIYIHISFRIKASFPMLFNMSSCRRVIELPWWRLSLKKQKSDYAQLKEAVRAGLWNTKFWISGALKIANNSSGIFLCSPECVNVSSRCSNSVCRIFPQ